MAFHPTGMQDSDPVLVGDGAFVHFSPDGTSLGLFGAVTKDTQHIKRWDWEFDGELTGTEKLSHRHLRFHYRSPEMPNLAIARDVWLEDGQHLRESFTLTNHGTTPIATQLTSTLATQFDGIFQIREEASHSFTRDIQTSDTSLRYRRADNGTEISTRLGVDYDPRPTTLETSHDTHSIRHDFTVALAAGESTRFGHHILMDHGHALSPTPLPTAAEWRREFGIPDFAKAPPRAWLPMVQAADDLHAMMMQSEQGIILAAGMPRFMNPFGRDQLLTALKIMPQDASQPWRGEVVKGILRFLAAHQGQKERHYTPPSGEAFVVETKGDIPHEVRFDEQSGLGLTDRDHPMGKRPFGRYYGTADTAPLFAAVVSEYCTATGDAAFAREMLPALQGVLEWMDDPARSHRDANGFICYEATADYVPGGPLANKVWKDSADSAMRTDGKTLIAGSQKAAIAFIEVQGYAYRAYRGAAETYRTLGDADRAASYDAKALALQENIQQHFLTTDADGKPVYAMAIGYVDGSTKMEKLNVHSSNPAHALWTGVFGDDPAAIQPILDSLQSPDHLWSGWGFRSLGKNEAGYDTRADHAYHNGPVWPHEPIIEGLQRYGQADLIDRATRAIYDLAQTLPSHSIPELITGDARRELPHAGKSEAPESLGTASRIQTWSAAALLKVMEIRAQEKLPDLTTQTSRGR